MCSASSFRRVAVFSEHIHQGFGGSYNGYRISIFLSILLQSCSFDVCFFWLTNILEKKSWLGIQRRKWLYMTCVLDHPNVSELSVETSKKWELKWLLLAITHKGVGMWLIHVKILKFLLVVLYEFLEHVCITCILFYKSRNS